MDHTFFGINAEYRQNLHLEIFDFLYHSKGSFNHQDLYNMPVSLRTFYFKRLIYQLGKEKEAHEKANKKTRSR